MKLGIIRERKSPPDFRVPLIPWQCAALVEKYRKLDIFVENYPQRCFPDAEYEAKGITVTNDLSHCDVIMGVKEIPVEDLLPGKTYFFFSHTIKKQAHNRKLLQAVLEKNIRLVDYECLRYPTGERVLGFGRYAGIVGAYNGFLAWGKRYQLYQLKPAHLCFDRKELEYELTKVRLAPMKILLTGAGRVGNGALEILRELKIRQVSMEDYLQYSYHEPVFAQVEFMNYNRHKEGKPFDEAEFFRHPDRFESDFAKFLPHTDLLLAGHFWSSDAPRFFTREDMCRPDFSINVIADISCDIDGPIPSTIRASKIGDPIYGYDPLTGLETDPFAPQAVTVMAVDNLPCELPRDASEDFGDTLVDHVFPLLMEKDPEGIIANGTIAAEGKLTERYSYLQDYVDGK